MKRQIEDKECSRCGSWRGVQPLDEFDKDSRTLDGRRSVCKFCRREERIAKLDTPDNGRTPSGRNAKKGGANISPKAPVVKMRKVFVGFWLFVLFCGGFILSALNGMFAFLETAQVVELGSDKVTAAAAASVLTLGTAISASWSVRLLRESRPVPAMALSVIFLCMQSLNLVVNFSGVQKRLLEIGIKQSAEDNEQEFEALQSAKREYQRIIDRHPPTNKSGNPIVWKSEITHMVAAAQAEINRLNKEILNARRKEVRENVSFDWPIVTAWLVLPELAMLTAILVFSLGFTDKPDPNSAHGNYGFSTVDNHTGKANDKH